jgi:hypothetical protein
MGPARFSVAPPCAMVEWIVCIHPLSRCLTLLMHQFVFIGNPSDSGEGNFEPAAFALFVVQMNEIDTVVNVFFDETILPEESTVSQGALQALMQQPSHRHHID